MAPSLPATKLPYCRLLLLAALFALILAFAITAGTDDSPSRAYLCNTTDAMIECHGADDADTCADVNGGVACVESACGYQIAPKVDISVSGVNVPPGPTAGAGNGTPTDAKAGFMIFWSFVPYALFVVLAAAFLWAGDTTSLSFIFLLGFVAIVNELIFKKVLVRNRPRGSCLYFHSYGMPSGHAATSVGMLTDMTLEIWLDRPEWSLQWKLVMFASAAFFLAPVPHSRVYLNDHFREQVGVGAAEGILVASLWFLFMYKVARTRLDGWIDHSCCRWFSLRNTYRNGEPFCPEWSPWCGRPMEREGAENAPSSAGVGEDGVGDDKDAEAIFEDEHQGRDDPTGGSGENDLAEGQSRRVVQIEVVPM